MVNGIELNDVNKVEEHISAYPSVILCVSIIDVQIVVISGTAHCCRVGSLGG